jgi:hypothetical protein
MRSKDTMFLESLYLKTKGILTEQAENEFYSDVRLNVYSSSNFSIEEPKTAFVKYRIEVEYRQYGIKEITASYISANPFDIEVVDYDDEDNRNAQVITVDLSVLENVETNFSVGEYGQVYPQVLNVYLDENFKPISAKLEF